MHSLFFHSTLQLTNFTLITVSACVGGAEFLEGIGCLIVMMEPQNVKWAKYICRTLKGSLPLLDTSCKFNAMREYLQLRRKPRQIIHNYRDAFLTIVKKTEQPVVEPRRKYRQVIHKYGYVNLIIVKRTEQPVMELRRKYRQVIHKYGYTCLTIVKTTEQPVVELRLKYRQVIHKHIYVNLIIVKRTEQPVVELRRKYRQVIHSHSYEQIQYISVSAKIVGAYVISPYHIKIM